MRKRHLTPALVTYYEKPIMIVEGSMQYVYDEKGRRYLDALGGIVTISVGHCHPYVTQKAREQMETLAACHNDLSSSEYCRIQQDVSRQNAGGSQCLLLCKFGDQRQMIWLF